ncbi:ECF transporter S component [Clostridium merdae]|uniref:ECF transporter S component n=1 Tax=Clostridium merdae TaxID=1958780 RepID=UPI000A26F936|nr:ECF transporter S component [Clostridium merdae]
MQTSTKALSQPSFSALRLTLMGMMIALTVILLNTPLGVITLPMIRITIAHMPILITAILFGLTEGLIVGFAFGACTLFIALTSPVSILDPFFVNPLVSILPRVLIPVTTYYCYQGLQKLLPAFRGKDTLSVTVSLAIGNLTNTFGVYAMLYLLYAAQILEKTGTPALHLILGLISTSTVIKCVGIMLIGTPLILALQKAMKHLLR